MTGLVIGPLVFWPVGCYIATMCPFGGCDEAGCNLRLGIVVPDGGWLLGYAILAVVIAPSVLAFVGWCIGSAIDDRAHRTGPSP
jgi:hypothetical protein